MSARVAGGLVTARRSRGTLRRLTSVRSLAVDTYHRRPGMLTLTIGFAVFAVGAVLEAINYANGWLLFEDVTCAVAPTVAAAAVAIAALRGQQSNRALRLALAASLGFVAVGQLIADAPDITGTSIGALAALSDILYVVGAVVGVVTLMGVLYRQLDRSARLTVILDGLIMVAAAMTIVLVFWMSESDTAADKVASLVTDPTASLLVPLASAAFFASAAAALVAAMSLRIQPSRGGVWAVAVGVVLMAIAWEGWIMRFLAQGPDRVELMDFIFPAGSLLVGYGGITWTVARGGGLRYERLARGISDWLPIAAIVACAVLDVMPRSRPLAIDPIAIGTCCVVLLAVVRLRILQDREREVSRRLTREMSERAATTVSLARLEAEPTIEATARRVCLEALRIDGIDSVVLYSFSPNGVVPMAQEGSICRPVTVGEPIPERSGRELMEHVEFGLWLDSWVGRTPRDDYELATIESGLKVEALAPLFWNDAPIGVLSLGANGDNPARPMSDRLATLTEFSVMSAAVLGPMLAERWQRDVQQDEVRRIIASQSFMPVFQPIVSLETREFVGFEALTRFADGSRPDQRFIAADKVGMMVPLETACLNLQVEQAAQLPAGSFLSLNVSPSLAMRIMPVLDVVAAADRSVVLEITEHAEIDDYTKLTDALAQVRTHAMLAVDDAGAGYAGLHHILELRPQYVKLDISLVRNIDSDPARQAMVTGMAHFARSVGCALIAEGIETERELAVLQNLNIEFGQGYYLARPEPIEYWAATSKPSAARARRPRKAA